MLLCNYSKWSGYWFWNFLLLGLLFIFWYFTGYFFILNVWLAWFLFSINIFIVLIDFLNNSSLCDRSCRYNRTKTPPFICWFLRSPMLSSLLLKNFSEITSTSPSDSTHLTSWEISTSQCVFTSSWIVPSTTVTSISSFLVWSDLFRTSAGLKSDLFTTDGLNS